MTSLLSLFLLFFKIGIFTVGGGYVIISLVQQELVSSGLLTLKESIDLVAIAEMTPGPFAINAATFTGMKLYGVIGAISASSGMALPSFIICLIVARFFFGIQNKPIVRSVLLGIRPVVLALIVSAMVSMAISAWLPNGIDNVTSLYALEWPVLIVSAASAILLLKTKISPIILLAAAGIAGAIFLH